MDNQSVLASIMDHDQKKADSKKSFTRKIGTLMSLLFGADIVALILQIVTGFFNFNADLVELSNVISRDSYTPVHILM
jgi:hypothetical protein